MHFTALSCNAENQPHVSDAEARERTKTESETQRVRKTCMRVAVLVLFVVENQPDHKCDRVDYAECEEQQWRSVEPWQASTLTVQGRRANEKNNGTSRQTDDELTRPQIFCEKRFECSRPILRI